MLAILLRRSVAFSLVESSFLAVESEKDNVDIFIYFCVCLCDGGVDGLVCCCDRSGGVGGVLGSGAWSGQISWSMV